MPPPTIEHRLSSAINPCAATSSTERRWNRTIQPEGCSGLPVLKTVFVSSSGGGASAIQAPLAAARDGFCDGRSQRARPVQARGPLPRAVLSSCSRGRPAAACETKCGAPLTPVNADRTAPARPNCAWSGMRRERAVAPHRGHGAFAVRGREAAGATKANRLVAAVIRRVARLQIRRRSLRVNALQVLA
jgi:hypothetical protein